MTSSGMNVANIVAKAALKFYNDPLRGTNGRYCSWEHCYKVFHDARVKRQGGELPDYDYLSLHLAFYLASWGMYRGSSFLLQQDYKKQLGRFHDQTMICCKESHAKN